METMGKTFRLIRHIKGANMIDVSEKSGISRAHISQMERNRIEITDGYLIRIANALNIPVSIILLLEKKIKNLGPDEIINCILRG